MELRIIFLKNFLGCSNNGALDITNKTELLKSLNNNMPSCKDVKF